MTKLPLGLRQVLESGDCVLFLGAGVGAHYKRADGTPAPNGEQLAKDIIARFKLNIDPTDLPRVAQLAELRNTREDLDKFVKKSLANLEPDEYIKSLLSA